MGRWRRGGRDTTESYRQLDVRRMQRGGFLKPGSWSTWRWSRNGEVFATIQVRADFNCVTLTQEAVKLQKTGWIQDRAGFRGTGRGRMVLSSLVEWETAGGPPVAGTLPALKLLV